MVFGAIILFCAGVLAFLMILSAAFFNDPEFDYADDMVDAEEKISTPLLGVVLPREKRDIDA